MNVELAERLTSLRKERGYSQETLAAALNISRQAISKWERGEASPDTDNLIALALLYNVSLDFLVGFSLPEREEPADMEEPEKETVLEDTSEHEPDIVENIKEEPPVNQGFTIEDDEHIVHIENGVLTVTHKPKLKRSLFSKLFGRKQ